MGVQPFGIVVTEITDTQRSLYIATAPTERVGRVRPFKLTVLQSNT